ncbi:TMV resistance protein N-like [Eucalyptus grandis]|uniref:TMV resistance protein N-like n=1 Tax=Eucalyptus grandis TaxID=71139 RepID=UPI00192EEC61|nr:TMV resistance protein N-like [Eucalyptus grandis]
MALQLWETLKESIVAFTGLSPATFFTVLALGLTVYYVVSGLFGSLYDRHQRPRDYQEQMQPLPPPVQLVETSEDELKQYDGTDPKKSLLMANRGQIYDVSQCRRNYDVFLSFRGTDVRNNFVGHLYTALDQRGMNTYFDNEELKKGEQLSAALMEAIEDSRIAIVVFSENYASSTWCLDELAKIMECKKQRDLIVFPVFYKVEPREVRTPRDDQSYAQALAKHEVKFEKDPEKVKKWKQALYDAGSLSGQLVPENAYEAGLIQGIVRIISTQLDRTPLNVAKYPVGIDSRVQELQTILNLQSKDDILMVGLWGQGGIGKTTLAKAIYNAIFREFQGSSFLDCVSENFKSFTDLVHLQKKLLSQVLRKELIVFSVDEGSQLIQDRLSNKKVLIILDGVDDEHQLNALAGDGKWFGKGSRIIITTRNKHLLTSHGVYSDKLYEVTTLKCGEALELFRKHAFLRSQKIEIRSNLVDSVLHYAKGLPLALEVLGSFLCGKGEHHWESTLEKLAKSPPKKINDVLKVSYDGLEDDVKEIFLDIACFFKGQKTKHIKEVLDSCDFDTTFGVNILIERSLISEEDETLQMHDLIKLMGMEIVKKECCDDAGKRSRLWLYDDVLDVLSRDAGTDAIKAIVLKLPKFEETYICPNAFTNMRTLRLLILHNVGNSFQGPVRLPSQLRCLELHNCALIPEFGYGRKRLVRLDMPNCKIKELPKCKVFHELYGCREVVMPGGEMPEWLLPNNDGHISFMASKDLLEKFLGIAFCVVTQAKCGIKYAKLNIASDSDAGNPSFLTKPYLLNFDNVLLQCYEPRLLWGRYSIGPNDWHRFMLTVTASDNQIVKICGFRLICKPLENDLEIFLQHNQSLDPALLYEVQHEDNQTSMVEESSSETKDFLDNKTSREKNSSSDLILEGSNVTDISIQKCRYSRSGAYRRNIVPGGEMPEEFVPVEDGTISFMASQDLYDKFLGLALCVVFSVEDGKKEISFDIVPHINDERRNVLSGTLGSFDLDHTWIQYLKPNALWGLLEGGVDFGQFDEIYLRFSLNLRVSGGTLKMLGYMIRCGRVEDDLKAVLEDNKSVNPASLYEEDSDEPEDGFDWWTDSTREFLHKCHIHRRELV